jgi:DNA replication protein DnaC
MNIDGQIASKLNQLRLTGMLETLDVRLRQAEDSNSGYMDFLMSLIEDEFERRQSRQLLRRLKKRKRHLRVLISLLIPIFQ